LKLKRGFTTFLRRRRALAHFARHPLIDSFARHGPPVVTPQAPVAGGSPAAPPTAAATPQTEALITLAQATPAEALKRWGSSAQGLAADQAAQRRQRDGPNEVAHELPLPAWLHLWRCYQNPFNLLLTALAVVSFLGHDTKATTVIVLMVALSTGIRFVQEGRSHRAAAGLRALVSNTATVLRPAAANASSTDAQATHQDIPMRELVAGDVVALSAGDMIPADGRVLEARDLFVAQAAMTGEAMPVEKFAAAQGPGGTLLDQHNLVFMGTNVVSGTALVLVAATGGRSYFGHLAASVVAPDATPNAFQAGVNSVSWLLIRFAMVMVPIVFVVNGWTKGDWLQALLFALSVAVGLTPEMLPMIVTSTLAKGAVLLSRKKVVVKRLDAIQNFGAMDVLCTDKTGTLTQDKIALARKTDAFGQPSTEVLTLAYLNSHYQTGLKNLLDHAVLAHVELADELKLARDWRKIDEIPFDFERRRMSVVVAAMQGDVEAHHDLICKGALEEVLAICTQVRTAAGDVALSADLLAQVHQAANQMADEGLRVVAVASKRLPPAQATYGCADESALTLVGTIAFLDPPKESAAPALRALAAHGVRVLVLTGDNDKVTTRVCRQVGLAVEQPVLGSQIEAMSATELAAAVQQHRVFARLTPLHKERIVRALRAAGHVVGFMGDGINDAPALRAADIGISVDTAVDIAKEAADIILLEKSLLVLDDGVVEGRTTFCNMLKYIRMTASSNFGNVLSVLVASAFLPFLPMLPIQLLVQNLLYDLAQTGIPFDNVDAQLVAKPLAWNPHDIGRFMLFFGPISSLFDIITFALMWWVLGANTLAQQGLFQSGWFVVGLLTQTLVVHMLRTPLLPFVQSRAAPPLMAMTALIVVLGIALPMGWFGALSHAFALQPLPGFYFVGLLGILLGYGTLTTVMKRVYIRRYGWQ
jgi:Mg2+-importing ATPase